MTVVKVQHAKANASQERQEEAKKGGGGNKGGSTRVVRFFAGSAALSATCRPTVAFRSARAAFFAERKATFFHTGNKGGEMIFRGS